MTKEEAIRHFEQYVGNECYTEKHQKACEMAIAALRAQPPNDPLTLEELREMDGEPVWLERNDGAKSRWAIVGDFESLYGVYFGTGVGGMRLPYEECEKTWTAYRRKLEEGRK